MPTFLKAMLHSWLGRRLIGGVHVENMDTDDN